MFPGLQGPHVELVKTSRNGVLGMESVCADALPKNKQAMGSKNFFIVLAFYTNKSRLR